MKKFLKVFLLLTVVFFGMTGALRYSYATEDFSMSFDQDYAKPGQTLSVSVSGGDVSASDLTYVWYKDDTKLSITGNSCELAAADAEKMIKVEAYKGATKLGETFALCSYLPVVYINTETGTDVISKEDYINATVTIKGNYKLGTDTLYDGAAEIKGHGNSTWKWFPKKAYKLKLETSSDLLGMGKNKHWVLLANYIDESCLRNKTAQEAARILGADNMDCEFVDVVLNGEVRGNYTLSEQVRIGKTRVNIFDWEDAGESAAKAIAKKEKFSDEDKDALKTQMSEGDLSWISTGKVEYNGKTYTVSDYYTDIPTNKDGTYNTTGGYLMELDTYFDELTEFYTNNGAPVMVDKPEALYTDTDSVNYIKDYVNNMETAFYSADHTVTVNEKKVSYTDLVDADSLVSFWLSAEFMFNETGGRSTYFYKDTDEKVVFGPVWDFDCSSDSVAPFGETPDNTWITAERPWFSGIMKDPYFAIKAKEQYLESREELAELASEDGTIDEWADYVAESAQKNNALWSYSRGYEKDTAAMKAWINRRIKWLDLQFTTDSNIVKSMGSTVNEEILLDITSSDAVASNETDQAFYAMTGSDNVLNIQDSNSSSAAVYINGEYIDTVSLTDGQGQIPLNSEYLTEETGTKNVIVVRTDAGMQFATLTLYDNAPTIYKVSFIDQTASHKVVTYTVPEGEYIIVPDSESRVSDKLFVGWSCESELYQPGDIIYVDHTMDNVSAVYELCKDSQEHQFEATDDGLVCKVCGAFKDDTGYYIDVTWCSFAQSSRYNTKYNGKHAGPAITLTYKDKVLTEGTDYDIYYENDVNPGFATYTIIGKKTAGYCGTAQLTYRILPRPIDDSKVTIKLAAGAYTYTGKSITPDVTVKIGSKNVLTRGTDYTVSYKNNVKIGTATVTITGKNGLTGTITKQFNIVPQNASAPTLSNGAKGITVKWEKAATADKYRVYRRVNTGKWAKVKETTQTSYTDTAAKTNGAKYQYRIMAVKTVSGTVYCAKACSSAKTIYRVTQPVIKTVTAASKSFSVRWTKNNSASGYQIQYATNSKFTSAKTVKVSGKTTVKKNISKLTGKKKYYVRVRTYKTVGKTNYYSVWSNVKAVATKK